MTRIVFALLALLFCSSSSVRADTLPLFEDVPATYMPGTPFQFTVRVPALTDFTAFSVDLYLDTEVPNPSLFVSSAPATVAPGGRYVFPSNATFQSGSTLLQDATFVLLTFTDSTGAPVVTKPGVNDTLAVVTVIPGASLTGAITLSLGANTTFDANSETQHPNPQPITITQADAPPTSPVPAPPGAVLLGISSVLLGARNRLVRVTQRVC